MNERIKELLTQAGVRSEIMLDDSSRDVECLVTVYDGSIPSIYNWEKFAELIVNECLDIIDIEVYGMLGVHVMKKISERFGVE